MRKSLEDLGHKVVTAGRSEKNAPKLDFEFQSSIVSIEEISDKIKDKFDLILLFHLTPHFWIKNIEKSKTPTAVYLFDTHVPFNRGFADCAHLFNYVFSAELHYINKLKKDGQKNVFWSPSAFYPKIIKKYNSKKIYGAVFLGSNNHLHNPRRAIYLILMEKFAGLKIIKGQYFDKLAKIYSQSKIVFNIPSYDDVNYRDFESLACQSLLITHQNQQGLDLLLKDKVHLVTFTNIFDAVKKIKFYLKNDKESGEIAKAGYLEVHKNHTYEKRMKEILKTIKLNISRKNLSANQCHKIAVSHYLAGAIDQADYWFKKAQKKSPRPSFENIKYLVFSKLNEIGGRRLQKKLFFIYAKQAGIRALFWQLRHF